MESDRGYDDGVTDSESAFFSISMGQLLTDLVAQQTIIYIL